jgi:uncharacterized membrane protein YcaP (DUF421 family)
VRQVVTGEPLMLLYRGEFLRAALRQARVTDAEVRAALRSAGFGSVAQVRAVVLETDGSFSVVGPDSGQDESSLAGVSVPDPRERTHKGED